MEGEGPLQRFHVNQCFKYSP